MYNFLALKRTALFDYYYYYYHNIKNLSTYSQYQQCQHKVNIPYTNIEDLPTQKCNCNELKTFLNNIAYSSYHNLEFREALSLFGKDCNVGNKAKR